MIPSLRFQFKRIVDAYIYASNTSLLGQGISQQIPSVSKSKIKIYNIRRNLVGFYDKKIKQLYERCPRLVIYSINSIFNKKHQLDAEVAYLDKEQNGDNKTFMDMLIEVEESKYHFEFQLLEGNMAVRMYEYSIKETIRELKHTSNQECNERRRYEIEVIMPAQAVIFLAGSNKEEQITVHLTLPDGQDVDYQLPCISASQPIEELIRRNLFILIPFQQVQFNMRMNQISKASDDSKHQIAMEIVTFHKQMKKSLEKLYADGIIRENEYYDLIEIFSDVEGYLIDKDEKVRQEVDEMGDNDYISRSEKARAEGIELGELKFMVAMIIKKLKKKLSPALIAEQLELDGDKVQAICDIASKQAPDYDEEAICKQYLDSK